MADSNIPKYSLLEIERRWLVDRHQVGLLDPASSRRIEDVYLSNSRLRLRKMAQPDGSVLYKLGKKYGPQGSAGEPITNLYLTAAEHAVFDHLAGARCCKIRYLMLEGALDVYEFPQAGLTLFEREFDSPAAAFKYVPPPFVTAEITQRPEYSGAAIAWGGTEAS